MERLGKAAPLGSEEAVSWQVAGVLASKKARKANTRARQILRFTIAPSADRWISVRSRYGGQPEAFSD